MSTITLKNNNCTAKVLLKGAEMASFKGADGREVMWHADPNVWGQHSPVLFPVCCRPIDGKVIFDGVEYPMTMHGFARERLFTVVKQGDDFVDLAMYPDDETRQMYPFEFVFHVIYTLLDNGYTTTFVVENKSDKVMPFCVGGHPGFAVPMEENADFEDYQLVFPQVEEGKNMLVPKGGLIDGYSYLDCFHNSDTLPLSYDLIHQHDTLIFPELKSRSVKLVHKTSGKGIHFEYPKFEALGIWTKTGMRAPYVCLEPWHGLPASVTETGRFEEKPFATFLAPGMSWQASFTMTQIG